MFISIFWLKLSNGYIHFFIIIILSAGFEKSSICILKITRHHKRTAGRFPDSIPKYQNREFNLSRDAEIPSLKPGVEMIPQRIQKDSGGGQMRSCIANERSVAIYELYPPFSVLNIKEVLSLIPDDR